MPRRRGTPLPTILLLLAFVGGACGTEILSKSRLESCSHDSDAGGRLKCDRKLVVDLAVPSGASGGEASLVARVAGVEEENDTPLATKSIRDPPVITVSKSATYALYALTYLDRDVAYRPDEKYVKTHKCEPYAGAKVVGECERLWDEKGNVIKQTEPICCPCGPHRVQSKCGDIWSKLTKGKANTAHCVRFPGDWFHVFGIGAWSLRFSIRVQVKKGSSVWDVVVGPENKTVVSGDNFLRVKVVGDYTGYTSIPSFEDNYLVTPRKGTGSSQPQDLGNEHSKWMILDRVRFTLDGLECDKIGVGYEAYRNQPNFCSAPYGSCLGNQLWNFWEYDKRRIDNSQLPLYIVEGRFQRINQHPNAGAHTFSVGVTEDLNTNLLIELMADDIEYVYQRSPAKIIDIRVPTFEALSQVGIANVTTKNIGKLESSYSLTFKCSSGISPVEEQLYTMKPDEVIARSFELRSTTDQAAMHQCEAILKASDFSELDREGYRFSTAATVYNNGAQIGPTNDHKKGGFWDSIKALWRNLIDFLTGRLCWTKCPRLFDFGCHIQYVCIGWILLLLLIPAAVVFLWLLHQEGLFDPLYDWWGLEPDDDYRARRRHQKGRHHRHHHDHRHLHGHGHGHGDHHHHHHGGHHQRRRHHHPPAWDVEGHHHDRQQHSHEAGRNHRRGYGEVVAVAAAPLRLDRASRPGQTEVDAVVEYRERRSRHERHGGHGHRDGH
ncbi:protein HAPLESS 2-A [Oryza glaberrima]|uniref:Generative cell specific-1/HAP2 domain-containing protein n=1 Tax=Oryza glaberrima TaxID=4538 RepID=I1PTW9_ORYGL|nr:protein HAPLESS 2-A [Oryza glaberrima]